MRTCILALALFCAITLPTRADDPTLEEMDAYAAKLDAFDAQTLKAAKDFPALYVAPNGAPENPGTAEAPLDLAAALSDKAPLKPGMVVWLKGGTYRGPFEKAAAPCGAPGKPIIYRAMPGERVVLSVPAAERTVLTTRGDHVWFWGLEITADTEPPTVRGDAVKVAGGDGLKLINLHIHNTPNRSGIGGWNVGNDQEFYGCVVTRVGRQSNAYAHGIYTQNTKKHTVKRITDCLFYDTYGFGVHCYGSDPALANYRFEGVGAWRNALPEGSEKPVVNFLVGGKKDQDNMIARDCFTHFPAQGRIKRGADFGYIAKHNGDLLLERNVFVGGTPAVHVVNWQRPMVRGNRIASPHGLVHHVVAKGEDASGWDANAYFAMGVAKPFSTNANPYKWRNMPSSALYDFATWQKASGRDATTTYSEGRPTENWVIVRPNRYEPGRGHVIVYNWTGAKTVAVPLDKILTPGASFRIMDLHDLGGDPVLQGRYENRPVVLPVTGPSAPEFAGYLVLTQ